MPTARRFRQIGLLAAAALVVPLEATAQQIPRDYAIHGSRRLAIAASAAALVIEPLSEGRSQVQLTTKSGDALTLSAQTLTVSMAEGGFTLTATRDVAMSGSFTLTADSVLFRVSSSGDSVLEAKRAVVKNRDAELAQLVSASALPVSSGESRVSRGQQGCLHDANESEAERKRRQSALGATRFINTVEYRVKGKDGKFLPLSDFLVQTLAQEAGRVYMADKALFAQGEVVPGFKARLTTDGNTYSFIITDMTDPCRFSYFSDTQAVIYEGQVIR